MRNTGDDDPAECGGRDMTKITIFSLLSSQAAADCAVTVPIGQRLLLFQARTVHKMLFDPAHIDLSKLESLIRDRRRPVHINMLARTAVSAWLEQNAQTRQYAPGATYEVGETIRFNGHSTPITAIQPGYNPQQGKFQILTLALPDGSHKHMAAGIAGASPADRVEVAPEQVRNIVVEDGLAWRTAVHKALTPDNRFVAFQDEQGDQYCLATLLPAVTTGELQQAWTVIQFEAAGMYTAVSTEKLVAHLWEQSNDGSDDYHLFAFALNAALQEYREVQYVAGAGWMLAERWQQATLRPSLIGPRIANTVAEATDDTEEEEEAVSIPEPAETASEQVPDLESWRQERRKEAVFTLSANHYYGRWLPLNDQTQRLFPPRPCRITVYHRFGGQEAFFTAILNPEQKRILAEQAMYDAFYENGIYSGARLIISHRGSDYDYDMRTQPISAGQTILVRRIALTDGQLEYWDDEEPLRYQVDGDVFVADARWEDLPALFQQAVAAEQGIFSLIFQTCQRWQRERGTPLIVTATELFEAIHFGPRLTSPATIAFELWRRLAFVSVGQGRYQFREEKGGRTRALGLSGRRLQIPPGPLSKGKRKTKSLAQLESMEQPQTDLPVADNPQAVDRVDPDPRPPTFERTATGQLIAADLLPLGPLFNETEIEPLSWPRGTRCFVFQQRPDSEYEDHIGRRYSWKEGSPNSLQVQPGDLFIYYRPGEKVFFGTGQVDFVEKRGEDEDGRSLYEATVTNYEAWKPPLPFSPALGQHLEFIQTHVLGIGQAGIRHISRQDFQILRHAYTTMQQGHSAISLPPSPDDKAAPPHSPLSPTSTPRSSTTARPPIASLTESSTNSADSPSNQLPLWRDAHDDGVN